MSNIINFSDFSKTKLQNFENLIAKAIEDNGVYLTEGQESEVLEYSNKIWALVIEADKASNFSFNLGLECTQEQLDNIVKQIEVGVANVLTPKQELIKKLVSDLIVNKINQVRASV